MILRVGDNEIFFKFSNSRIDSLNLNDTISYVDYTNYAGSFPLQESKSKEPLEDSKAQGLKEENSTIKDARVGKDVKGFKVKKKV